MEKNLCSNARVLIVDDMRVNCLILSSLLKSYGLDSDLAESGEQCLELCRDKDYDLILLDHRMPGLDGVDTMIKLKEMFRRKGREVPIICHTTEDARPNINLYKAAGFVDVMVKPIHLKEFSKILMTYLPEKYVPSEDKTFIERTRFQSEIERLPEWLYDFSGLDLALGLENCETAEDYLDALTIFADSAVSKAAEIERLLNEGNYNLYAIKVGSLSSMAHLIGARGLAVRAADLEYAGKHADIILLQEATPRLLRDYRAYAQLSTRLKEN